MVGVLFAADRAWPHRATVTTSFPGYWLVGRELAAGTPVVQLYDDAWLAGRMAEHGFPRDRMLGPPPLALTALPVCWLPYRAARSLWVLGLLTPALVGGVAWLTRRLPLRQALGLGALLLWSGPVTAGLQVGQVYPLLLLLHLGALEAWRQGRPAAGGLALSPLVLLRGWHGLPQAFGWLWSGRWRGAAWAGAGFVAGGLLSLPAVGAAAWRHFLLVQSREVGASPDALALAYQTWRSLALHLTTFDPLRSPDPPLLGAGPSLWLVGAAAIGGAGLWAGRRLPPGRGGAGFALWTTLALLLAPFAEDHHFVLAFLPLAVLWEEHPRLRPAAALAGLLILPAWGFDRPALLGGWRALLAYPRVWGGLVLLGALLLAARNNPRRPASDDHPPAPGAPA